jgi:hypothetical protein
MMPGVCELYNDFHMVLDNGWVASVFWKYGGWAALLVYPLLPISGPNSSVA